MTAVILALIAASAARAADYPLPPPPAVSTAATRLTFEADRLDYDKARATIHLRGHVLVRESTWTLKGEDIELDTERQTGRSRGDLLVEDGQSALYGDFGDFDFARHTGQLYHVSAGHGDWRVHARQARLSAQRKLDYLGADFTSCNFVPPHYHFHASRITVVPKKYMLARNTVFYLGPVPLFYVPVLYKSLKPTHFFKFKVQPGYDRRNGATLRGTMTTLQSPHTYSKLFLDYYQRQGVGVGGEVEHRKGDDRGMLTAYRVRENPSGTERWNVVGDAYQTLGSTAAAAQARVEFQSDADFNNDYARARLFPVQPQLINSAAYTYRWRQSNVRVAYALTEQATVTPTKYLKQTEDLPRVDYQTTPLRVWKLPWLNTFTMFADNNYTVGRPFLQRSAGGNWEVTRTLPLWRGYASWAPKAGYGQTYYNRFDEPADFLSTATFRDAFIGRPYVENTIRLSSLLGSLDLTHRYALRQKAGTFAQDAGAPDHGVDANLLSATHAFRPSRRVLARFSSAYDFRVFTDRPTIGFRDRLSPIVGEVYYTPTSTLDVLLRDDYALDGGNRSFLASAQFGDEQATYYSLGAGYNQATLNAFSSAPNRYYLSNEFGWAPASSTWHITAALRSDFASSSGPGHVYGFRLFDKEIGVAKVWHDFFTRAMVRFRSGGVREVFVRVDLKLPGKRTQVEAPHRDWESEWFPERKQGMLDRP